MIARGLPTHPNPQTIPQDMSKKRHTKEARIRAIREHEAGRSQAEICRQLNITAPTFYRWKKQLGMMTNSDAQRLRALEKDNKELKQMVADLLLEKRVLKVALEKKL
jgi:putative transposase